MKPSDQNDQAPLLRGAAWIRVPALVLLDVAVNLIALAAALAVTREIAGASLWRMTLAIAAAVVLFVLSSVVILLFVGRVLLPRLPVGRFPNDSRAVTIWLLHAAVASFPTRQFYRNYLTGFSLLGNLFYWTLGRRIAFGVTIGIDAHLGDPAATSIGPNTVIGDGAAVYAHLVEGNELVIDPVSIGRDVTIGSHAFVSPGVTIGDGAIVAAGAVVTKRTQIGPGEVWGGVPARRIRPASGTA